MKMQNCVRKASLLAIAVLLTLSGSAFAGDNAGATFSITTPHEISGVGPGATVDVAIAAAGMVGVKQFAVILEWSPADAIDVSASSFDANDVYGLALPSVEVVADGQGKVGAAAFSGQSGSGALGVAKLVTSSTVTTATEITINVISVSLGPNSSTRDVIDTSTLGLSVTVNPPAPPVTEPSLTANSATDLSLDFSAVGTGNKADGSDGEASFSVLFTGNTGAAAAGQTITWNITNNGAQAVYLLGATVVQINAGASRSVTSVTGADGSATAIFDSEGDKSAGSTSLSVTASTSAANSEGTNRALSVAFSATWDVPVPAELASFAGQVSSDKDVLLQWSVVSQSNNLGWEVYRSTDKVRFEKIGEMVLGAGTTDELMDYSFTDSGYPAVGTLYYYLKQVDLSGNTARSNMIEVVLAPAQVLPTANELHQNFPNPFNPETTISFDLKSAVVVELSIYDMAGQHIRTLVSGQALSAGSYSYHWDGLDDSGAKVGSGVYLYHLKSGEFTSVKKMALLK
ncbi:MAG: T9SS type A sorting domain-containing protein [Candidatus Latescibacteria bacterium]|nr:T9SS type A sorting domain-containing protein [Candidatus Latescibacterota bacterium]